MALRLSAVVVVFFLVRVDVGCSQEYRYNLPHVADGSFGHGSFRTTFVIFNNTDVETLVRLNLTDDDGMPLRVALPDLGTNSEFEFRLGAGASRMLQTVGAGDLQVGAAYARSSPADICVSSIFSVHDGSGRFLTEAGVGSSPPLRDFVLPVDTTAGFNTGVAIFNPASVPASITLSLRDPFGNAVATTELTPPLQPGAHLARFVAGADQLFPSVSNFKGTLAVSSSVEVCGLTLRQNASTASPTYTSLPVVSSDSTQTSMNFSHMANGVYEGVGFMTSFLIYNISGTPANVTLALSDDGGSPFITTLAGAGSGSSFNLRLQPRGSVFLRTDGTGPGKSGAARVISDVPIGAGCIFTVFDSRGEFLTEAGVGDSRARFAMTLPVDVFGNWDTGVALYNPLVASVTMTLRLLDGNGSSAGPDTTVTLPANGHRAKFASELFPGTKVLRGTIAISAPSGVAALTLRQNSSPLSYTTLPVASGASAGAPPLLPLLPAQASVTVAGNTVVNAKLGQGYQISGGVLGDGSLYSVAAVSASGSRFAGTVDYARNKYTVVVPAGTYVLAGCFLYGAGSGKPGVFTAFAELAPVQVSGNVLKDVTLAGRALSSISGIVGLGSLNTASIKSLHFNSTDGSVRAVSVPGSDGAFSARLPAGSYHVSLSGIIGTGVSATNAAFYNIGELTVSGDASNANFAFPVTTRLTGQIRGESSPGQFTVRLPSTVSAFETTGSTAVQSECIGPPTANSTHTDVTTDGYELLLTRNRPFNVQASIPVMRGFSLLGHVLFPTPTGVQVTMDSDATVHLNVPALPAESMIFGRVTDAFSRGLEGVVVAAVSELLGGRPLMSFTASTQTDAAGSYHLTVPEGTYRLTFTPPIPRP